MGREGRLLGGVTKLKLSGGGSGGANSSREPQGGRHAPTPTAMLRRSCSQEAVFAAVLVAEWVCRAVAFGGVRAITRYVGGGARDSECEEDGGLIFCQILLGRIDGTSDQKIMQNLEQPASHPQSS